MSGHELERLKAIAAAALLLRDEPHHITLHETGWELEHNLPCRVAGMRNCEIHQWVKKRFAERPASLGRFQIYFDDAGNVVVGAESRDTDPAKNLLEALEWLDDDSDLTMYLEDPS